MWTPLMIPGGLNSKSGECRHLVVIAWQRSDERFCLKTWRGGGGSVRLMSMQTGSTRGHHLANYHCWHIGADLNCHHKHITPCPNCPAICHHATRRATQYGEDGATGDSPMTKPPGQRCRQDRLLGHLLSLVLEDTPWALNVSYPSQCPSWLTGVYCVCDIGFLTKTRRINLQRTKAAECLKQCREANNPLIRLPKCDSIICRIRGKNKQKQK